MASGRVRLIGVATGCSAAALAMPLAAVDDASWWTVGRAIVAGLVAAVVALGAAGRRARGWALVAPPVALAAAVLLDVSAPGFIVVVLAVLAGLAAGLAAPRPWRPPSAVLAGAAVGIAAVVVARLVAGIPWALGVAVVGVLVGDPDDAGNRPDPSTGATGLDRAGRRRRGVARPRRLDRRQRPPGDLVRPDHLARPRDGDAVAITFDDGPNAVGHPGRRATSSTATASRARSSSSARPSTPAPTSPAPCSTTACCSAATRTTTTSGAGSTRATPSWSASIDAFQRQLGVCPRYYRPPHGQRTPFMNLVLHNRA